MSEPRKPEFFPQGDPSAPRGTAGWAEMCRAILLSAVDGVNFDFNLLWGRLAPFLEERAWTLITTKDGRHYRTFQEFATTPRPYGLGVGDYPQFREMLGGYAGKNRLARLLVDEPAQGERVDLKEEETSGHHGPKSPSLNRNAKRLHAVNRAPVPVRQLYDAGLLGIDLAARFGPAKPDDAKRQALQASAEALSRRAEAVEIGQPSLPAAAKKRAVNGAAREILALRPPTPLQQVEALLPRLSDGERRSLLARLIELVGPEWIVKEALP